MDMLRSFNLSWLPWLWLFLGGGLRIFDFGRSPIPLAAWLAPVFLLRFARLEDSWIVLPAVWLALFLAALIAYRGVIPVPGLFYPLVAALLALVWTLPYLADRLLAGSLPGFAAALVFPLAWVTAELGMARLSPFGTWGSIAYTQFGNLPLMQLASVAGLAGITFLMTWFASTVNWAWERGFSWQAVSLGVVAYAGVWSLVHLAGGARLARIPLKNPVRIAAIGWLEGILDMNAVIPALAQPALQGPAHDRLVEAFCRLQDYFLNAAEREALAGARIVITPEINLMVFQPDEAPLLERAAALAREQGIYLLLGLGVVRLGAERPLENKAVLFAPDGSIAYAYTKSRPVPGWESLLSVRGDGRLPFHASAFGRLSTAICYDLDFPNLIRNTREARPGLLLVPASDYPAIHQIHAQMAVFRAVENGLTLVRANRWGDSLAADPLGRVLAVMEDTAATPQVMVALVPVSRLPTLYQRVGDVFAWLCVAGLLGATVWVAAARLV